MTLSGANNTQRESAGAVAHSVVSCIDFRPFLSSLFKIHRASVRKNTEALLSFRQVSCKLHVSLKCQQEDHPHSIQRPPSPFAPTSLAENQRCLGAEKPAHPMERSWGG